MKSRRVGRRDLHISPVGFGGAPLGGLFRKVPDEEAQDSLAAAWEVGCRYFDTAPLYGHGLSERRFGDALREKDRDSYAVSTKAGYMLRPIEGKASSPQFDTPMPFKPVFDYSYDGVMRTFEDSLQRLGLSRVDILYVHDLDTFNHGDRLDERYREVVEGAFPAVRRLREEGVVKAVGLGVNEADVCRRLLDDADPDVFLLAGRYTLLEQAPLDDLLPACAERGVSIIVGGPYNSGILVQGPAAQATYNYGPAGPEIRERVGRIQAVCQAHNVAMPAAAVQFPLAHPQVSCVIPGGRTGDEVRQSAAWLEADIPPGLWDDLKGEGLMHPQAPTPKGKVTEMTP